MIIPTEDINISWSDFFPFDEYILMKILISVGQTSFLLMSRTYIVVKKYRRWVVNVLDIFHYLSRR